MATIKKPTKSSPKRSSAQSSKLRKRAIWIGIAVLLLVFSFALGPEIESSIMRLFTKHFPDIGKIYEAEQAAFPGYKVSVMKGVMYPPEGEPITSYSVGLIARKPVTFADVTRAGKIACATGLPSGMIVNVTVKRQYFPFPIYVGKTRSGTCP